MKKLSKNNRQNLLVYLMLAIFIGLLFARFFFSPYHGLYLYYDDATNQVLRFYQQMWQTIRIDHEFFKLWDWSNILGANYLASNSYYNLFSPFTWIIYFFSKEMIPYLLLYLSMFKLFLIGMISYKISGYYQDKLSIRLITMAILTFNGWVFAYAKYLFMWDAYVFMLLIILGIEYYLKTKKSWLLFFSLAALGIVNYYFLYMFCFIAVLYYCFRYWQLNKITKASIKDILQTALIFLLGILASMVVFLPNILNVLNSTRINNDLPWFISFAQLLRFFTGFLAKPEIYGSFNGFLDYRFGAAGWNGGMAFYSLMITPLLLPQLFKNKKHFKIIIAYAVVFIMVTIIPIYKILCGSLESRWFILIIILNAYTVSKILQEKINVKILITTIISLLVIIFAINRLVTYKDIQDLTILNKTTNYAYIYVIINGLALLLWTKYNVKYLLLFTICLEILSFNPLKNIDLSVKKQAYDAGQYDHYQALDYLVNELDNTARIDILTKQTVVNYPLLNILNSYNLSGFSGYHSLYNFTQDDFLNNRFKQVGSWYVQNQPYKQGLKSVLSNKYWISAENDEQSSINPPIGYEYLLTTADNYQIYQNKYYLPVIQVRYSWLNESDFAQYSILKQDILLRNNAVVQQESNSFMQDLVGLVEFKEQLKDNNNYIDAPANSIVYIEHELTQATNKTYALYNQDQLVFQQKSYFDYGYIDLPVHQQAYSLVVTGDIKDFKVYIEKDYDESMDQVVKTQTQAVSEIKQTTNGLTAKLSLAKDGYFISTIAYDAGWKLYVNQKEVPIEKVNKGFIGSYLKQGDYQIELIYRPAGLVLGSIISGCSLFSYLLWQFIRRKKNGKCC